VEIGASARLLAVLGDPVAHSLSPAMQNAAIGALGLDAVYVALRTPAAELAAVIRALAAVHGAGNVTVPHKEAMEGYVSRKTELCARVGACNTFWTEHGTMIGDNTDVPGVVAALRALGGGADRAERWLLIGTGGAARAVAVAAADAGARLRVRSRDPGRARDFAAWAASRGAAAAAAERGSEQCDLVINATPLGLKANDALPIPPASLNGARAALDLVYARGETPWVRALRAAGLAAADGRELLVQQGAAAFGRFFPDQAPPVEVMRAAVARALRA
jgi:shikimate dehydrogenase